MSGQKSIILIAAAARGWGVLVGDPAVLVRASLVGPQERSSRAHYGVGPVVCSSCGRPETFGVSSRSIYSISGMKSTHLMFPTVPADPVKPHLHW